VYGPEEFLELPLVGILLLSAVTPILLATPSGHKVWIYRNGSRRDRISLPHLAASLLFIEFAVGIVGNQVIDAVIHDDDVPSVDDYEELYKRWRRMQTAPVAPTLKTAEFHIAEKNEFARSYLRRHRVIVRVIRASAAALALLMLSMGVYEGERMRTKALKKRFTFGAFALAALLLELCVIAYATEVSQISKRVLELYTSKTPKEIGRGYAPAGLDRGRS